MAVSVTRSRVAVPGASKVVHGTIAFDSSYPTGGEALSKSTIGLGDRLDSIVFEPAGGYVPVYDYTNEKVKMFMGDNNNAADGPLIEVADTTDLSALTAVRFRAEGLGQGA